MHQEDVPSSPWKEHELTPEEREEQFWDIKNLGKILEKDANDRRTYHILKRGLNEIADAAADFSEAAEVKLMYELPSEKERIVFGECKDIAPEKIDDALMLRNFRERLKEFIPERFLDHTTIAMVGEAMAIKDRSPEKWNEMVRNLRKERKTSDRTEILMRRARDLVGEIREWLAAQKEAELSKEKIHGIKVDPELKKILEKSKERNKGL